MQQTSAFELITNNEKELNICKAKSNMMNAIIDKIKDKNWTVQEAAFHLDVSRKTVYDLDAGKISIFSFDMLKRMISKISKGIDNE